MRNELHHTVNPENGEFNNPDPIASTLDFIRQCVSGKCDCLDLEAIRDAINEAIPDER